MTKVGKMLIGDLFVMSANISNNVTEGFIMGLPPFHMDTFSLLQRQSRKKIISGVQGPLRKPLLLNSKEAQNKGDTQQINFNKQNN